MDSDAAKQQYAEAKRLFRAGRYDEALTLLQDLHAVMPYAKHVWLAEAECRVALGNLDEARSVCWQVLAQEEDARARRILARCESAAPMPPPLPAAPPAPLVAAPANFEIVETSLPEESKSYRRPLIAIAAVIVVAGAFAFFAERGRATETQRGVRSAARPAGRAAEPEQPESPPVSEDPVGDYAKLLNEKKALRDAAARDAEAKRIAEAEAASRKPGYEIPESEWKLDPDTGAPAWRPGIYRQLPCPGSWFEPWQGPRTLDLYIPLAYAERPEELFPTLSITMPHTNPGFLGLEAWAERRDVILIVINTSTNDFHPGGNTEAQIAAMEFLYGRLRAHPTLNFVAGMSGGARMALRAAARWPDAFAGVLMMAHSGDDLPLAPHLRIAIIHGRDDFNATAIGHHVQRLRAAGYELRLQVIPGGHITAPASEQVKMLDWMLDAARRDLELNAAADAEEF